MVLREHWLPSHSSSERPDSELSFGKVPQSGAALSERETDHPVLQLEVTHLPSLGRTAPQTGRLPPTENFSKATKPRCSPLTGSSCGIKKGARSNYSASSKTNQEREMIDI